VEGVMDNEKTVFMAMDPELFIIGEVVLLDLGSLKQPIQILHVLGTMLIDETLVHDQVKGFQIAEWTLPPKAHVWKVNLGIKKNHNT